MPSSAIYTSAFNWADFYDGLVLANRNKKIMPTYDKQQITKAISSMQAICDKGKAEVTKLVEAIIGEPLEDYTLRAGDVWENRSCRAVLVELNSQWALTGFMSNYFDAFQLGSAFYKSHLDMQTHLKERNYKRIGKASTTIQPL